MAEQALRSNQSQCVYCGNTVLKTTAQRTCRDCTRKWTEQWGDTWYEMDFHKALISDYIRQADSQDNFRPMSIDAAWHVPDKRTIESLPDEWQPQSVFHEAYTAIGELAAIYHQAGVRVGASRILRELRARGINPLPKTRTVEKFLMKQRAILPPITLPDGERERLIKQVIAMSVDDEGRIAGGAAPTGMLAEMLAGNLDTPPEDDYRQRARMFAEIVLGANGNAASLAPAMGTLTKLAEDTSYAIATKRL